MQDSPSTPKTPDSPQDITVLGAGADISTLHLEAKSDPSDVKTPLPGTWRVCKPKNKTPTTLFEPSSREAAKDFFLSSKLTLPPRPPLRQNLLDTPKSSRVKGGMICHGCHLQMGQGAHQGSAAGKNQCTLPHSNNCPGGIIEDGSYRGCPTGYVYHGQIVPESGFLNTLNQSDFMSSTPANRSPAPGQAPVQATPGYPPCTLSGMVSGGGLVISSHTGTDQAALTTQPGILSLPVLQTTIGPVQTAPVISTPLTTNTSLSLPPILTTCEGVSSVTQSRPEPVNSLGQVASSDPNDQLVYDMLRLSLQEMGEGARPKTSQVQVPAVQQLPAMTSAIQARVDALRAANQVQGRADDVPGGLNIANLRADPALQNIVGAQLQYIRGGIPALSSAKSAPAPGVGPIPPQHTQAVPVIQRNPAQYQGGFTPSSAPSQALTQPRVLAQHYQVGGLNTPQFPSHMLQGIPGQARDISANQAPPTPVDTVQEFLHQQQQQLLQLSKPHHVQQAAQKQQEYRLEYRCSPTSGRTYQVAVPVLPTPSPPVPRPPQVRYEWRCDPHSGATYQVPVQGTLGIDPDTSQQVPQLVGTGQAGTAYVLGHSYPHAASHYQQPQQTSVHGLSVSVPPLGRGHTPPQGVQHLLQQQAIPGPVQLFQQDLQSQPIQSLPAQNAPQLAQHLNSQPGRQTSWDPSQSLHQNLNQLYQQSASLHQGGAGQVAQQVPQHEQHNLKGIIPLNHGEVASKVTRVIDFAKKCPVKWAKGAKADSINLPLYSYGAITEIEAALSGRGSPMQGEVLLAKIRHLKNVFEVCCLNSTPSDFSTYGWQIARDYAMKVEEEVEQNFVSWQDMVPGVRTQTLILSQMEYPRQPLKKKPSEPENPKSGKKEHCTTFNSCTSEGKCEYEVANPGRQCNRKHECSWCRSNLQQGYKHQAWKCLKRQAAGQ